MEDRLSPKAQDLVKKSAKVKSASNDLVVEKERKERELWNQSQEKKVSWKAFVLILKPNNNVLHLLICMRGK